MKDRAARWSVPATCCLKRSNVTTSRKGKPLIAVEKYFVIITTDSHKNLRTSQWIIMHFRILASPTLQLQSSGRWVYVGCAPRVFWDQSDHKKNCPKITSQERQGDSKERIENRPRESETTHRPKWAKTCPAANNCRHTRSQHSWCSSQWRERYLFVFFC